jgi:hypothetical protein
MGNTGHERVDWRIILCLSRGFDNEFAKILVNACRLRWSTQHLLAVYSQEFEIPAFFSDVDSSAARPVRAALESSQIGPFLGGSIALKGGWCFRSCHAARDLYQMVLHRLIETTLLIGTWP